MEAGHPFAFEPGRLLHLALGHEHPAAAGAPTNKRPALWARVPLVGGQPMSQALRVEGIPAAVKSRANAGAAGLPWR